MGWHNEDLKMLRALAGEVNQGGEKWHCLSRGGRMLLLIREGAPASALQLYQPQRAAARWVRNLLMLLRPVGGLKLLKSVFLAEKEAFPLAEIARETGTVPQAILLGNPSQAARRSLVLAYGEKGEPKVIKLGTHPEANAAVTCERDFLQRWGSVYSAMVSCEAGLSGKDWEGFVVPFLQGKKVGMDDKAEILQTLTTWADEDAIQSLNSFHQWAEISTAWPFHDLRDELEKIGFSLMLKPSLIHGDLAPWNVIRDASGELRVIDWEDGAAKGIGGWDWVHFVYQTVTLVDRKDPEQTAEQLFASLREPECQSYLKHLGWYENEQWLLMTYLSAEQPNDPQFRRQVLGHVRKYER